MPSNASTDDDASSELPIMPMNSEDNKKLVEDTTKPVSQDDAPFDDMDESKSPLIIIYN